MCLLYKLLDQELLVSLCERFPIGLFLRTPVEEEFNFLGRMVAAKKSQVLCEIACPLPLRVVNKESWGKHCKIEKTCHRTRRSDAKGKSICLWIKFWTFNLLVQCLDQNRITSRYSCPAEAFEMVDFAAGLCTTNNQMTIFVTTEVEILCSSSLFRFSLPFLICTSFAGYDILRLRNDKYAMLPIL